MSQRNRILVVVGLAVGFAAAGLIGLQWASTRAAEAGVTLENFRRITVGMTEQECHQILGPPKNTSTMPPQTGMPVYFFTEWEEPEQRLTVVMVFDSRRLVEGGELFKGTGPNGGEAIATLNMGFVTDSPETLFARLRRWLGI